MREGQAKIEKWEVIWMVEAASNNQFLFLDMKNLSFETQNFEEIVIAQSDISFTRFWLCQMSGAKISDSEARYSGFDECFLCGADFSGSDLRWSSFRNADLTNAVFMDVQLIYSDFTGANLSGVKTDNQFLLNYIEERKKNASQETENKKQE